MVQVRGVTVPIAIVNSRSVKRLPQVLFATSLENGLNQKPNYL